MNEVQERIARLREKGWTLAAIADKVGVTVNAVEKWKAGTRFPRPPGPTLMVLDGLLKLKRVPKKKRYK